MKFFLNYPLPLFSSRFLKQPIKKCEHIGELVKWKQVHGPCLYLLQRKKYFRFFIQLTQRRRKICRLTPIVKQGAQNYQIIRLYEWRKSRHAPIVMHKIIVFWTLHMGVIYMYVYIHNQFETSNCWNRLCHPPPFFLLFTITIYALFNFCCWIAQVGHLEGQE